MLCQPIRYALPKSAFLLEVYYDKNGDFKEQPKWDTDGNKLTELDVSKNPELELLDCRDNMKSHWETGLKSHRFNTNVQLEQ